MQVGRIEKAMKETFGEYFKRELKARCKEDLSNSSDSESVSEQNSKEFQNLTRLKLYDDKCFDIGEGLKSSSSEKIFQMPKRKTEKIFCHVNPYEKETDEALAMRLQRKLNSDIEISDEKLALEITRIEGLETRATRRDADRDDEKVEAMFERELENLYMRKKYDKKILESESELENMNSSDFSSEEDEELTDTKN